MSSVFEGFLSCVCVATSPQELNAISEFSERLENIHRNFEIIVCVVPNSIEVTSMEKYCSQSRNLAIYEISGSDRDDLFTAGLELALGDWTLELPNNFTLMDDLQELIILMASDPEKRADSYQLIPENFRTVDRLLSSLSRVALEVEVHTMSYTPRLTRRAALQTWNTRKLRSKVLRVAPQLNRGIVMAGASKTKNQTRNKRLVRIGLRTIAHSSAKPLRWVSFFALIGALISILISVGILVVGISRRVVPGWTTTNLQISGLAFLILLVLGVLTEYIYQIAAASIDQPAFRVVREYISPRFIFSSERNIALGKTVRAVQK